MPVFDDPVLETPEEREKFYQELVKQREVERKTAIAQGKMDDPLVPKRLEDAISIVGTCMDMCPRFERYRRERENNLFEWETIPGTKRVNHQRAVKMYERAAGDKTLPSDLRPPLVLKRTLDYLFHDLLPRGGFSPTFNFIRDRSRSVRNDFTMQHNTGPLAMECHERCARFHILALYLERDREGFSVALEEQQLMNTLQSLKEFYNDQRATYESPAELEMRIYHRLIHIRDQVERPEPVPLSHRVAEHPMYKLTTAFRAHVQEKSKPITKTSRLRVDAEGMSIFGELAGEMMGEGGGGRGMVFLVACLLERLFGKGTVEGIDDIRGEASWGDIIDGVTAVEVPQVQIEEVDELADEGMTDQEDVDLDDLGDEDQDMRSPALTSPLKPTASGWLAENFGPTPSAFGLPTTTAPVASAFSNLGAAAPGKSPEASSSTPTPTPTSNGFAVPPRVQNNPFFPASNTSISPSPFTPVSSPPSPPQHQPSGKGRAVEPFSWGDPPTSSTSALNPRAPEFTPPPPLFQPQPQPTAKPVFGVTPIPIFNGFPTSAFSSPSSFGTPPVPKPIDTSPPFINTNGAVSGPSSPMTPGDPPPLAKVQPISLPSTPTLAAAPAPPSISIPHAEASPTSPFSQPRPKNSLQTGSGGGSGGGMLSPLVLASPFSPVKPQATDPGSLALAPSSSSGMLGLPISRKGKEKETAADADLEALALAFEQRGLVKRTTDRAEWAEACRQSEKYSQKVRREKGGLKRPSPNGKAEKESKRMRLLGNGGDEPEGDDGLTLSTAKRRASLRRRQYEAPRTDEDLAKRFQENKEEHARRWAQGSFLQTTRALLKSKSAKPPSSALWRLWLSLNPESDATAIWLECKFDVPGSGGRWETETVFSIPVVSKPVPEGYPGIIVFECTPLAGVEDDLERKYRVLDDCSRLRDIIKALPAKRHFVPSLLLFVWAADEPASSSDSSSLPVDFLDMIKKLVADSVIADFRAFCFTATTKDLDRKFGEAVGALQLDVEGRLVQSMTLRDVFRLFDPTFDSFISEWTENCSSTGEFDWTMYCRLLDAAVAILNKAAFLAMGLVGVEPVEHVLPAFRPDWNGVRDSESTFEAVASWLANSQLNSLVAGVVATDLQSHGEMGRDFPTAAFVDHLRGLALYHAEAEAQLQKAQAFFVLTKDIPPSLEEHNAVIQLRRSALSQAQRMSIRRSPRRRSRSLSEDTELTSSTYLNKRRRLSSNFEQSGQPSPASSPPPPHINGRMTPSPSSSTVSLAQTDSSSAPRVTIAMLRALTKDVKNKYGGRRGVGDGS
ncbi:hypothetical protein B0H17DRAFT_1162276 [Mycena rosella]|uniref:SAC3/GANP/THP3 conserved domain-containing protein n=1 Tax=Mycena rosella TaxID=1033263 RepID=A0AAD7CXN2_MYCRO|nr:hypothetical protein B0H17DRAFT_1162276 [Mycena rosella]